MQKPVARNGQPPAVIEAPDLAHLFFLLQDRGYEIIGPTVRNGAVVYDSLASPADLPIGWADVHEPGGYRLVRREDDAYFGFAVGPQSWKRFLFPPEQRLWSAAKTGNGNDFEMEADEPEPPLQALLGVRACELAAIAIQDRVFMGGLYVDTRYRARRENTLIIAVDCAHATSACFCTSMDTGPEVGHGFDLALTELIRNGTHRFVVQSGSAAGQELLAGLKGEPAAEDDLAAAHEVVERTAASIRRHLDTNGLHHLLLERPEHPEWDSVAERCLSCANCTMVCPTCFCSTVEDVTDLAAGHAERRQRWDSCFTIDFSYIHGGSVRSSVKSRYRQWLTHKFATWIDQFGTSGCVGCGRCITWCPVGIDVTDVAARIRKNEYVKSGAAAPTNGETGET